MPGLDLQHTSPIPLYHQIAEAIRYRIATGDLGPGAVLPPLREASARWGVNFHTVRRAYVELARQGLVTTEVPRGTIVLPPAGGAGPAGRGDGRSLRGFLDRVEREAREKHGLSLEELVEAIGERATRLSAGPDSPVVYVTECSETQSADLASQLMERWRVRAVPWTLGRAAPPGRGPVVATYFHYAEVRAAWPARLNEVHFLGIHLDPAVRARVRRRVGRPGGVAAVTFCEREKSMLHNIAADLGRLLPAERFRIVPRLVTRPGSYLSRHRGPGPILVSPRVWGELPADLRGDPRFLEARYVFEPRDLENIGSTLKWRAQ